MPPDCEEAIRELEDLLKGEHIAFAVWERIEVLTDYIEELEQQLELEETIQ